MAPVGTAKTSAPRTHSFGTERPVGGVDLVGRVGNRLGLDGRGVTQLEHELVPEIADRDVIDEVRRQAPLEVGLGQRGARGRLQASDRWVRTSAR